MAVYGCSWSGNEVAAASEEATVAMQGARRRRRWLVAAVALGAVVGCTPMYTPPPKPDPSTSGPDPDLAPRAAEAAYVEPGPYDVGVTTLTVESGRKAEVWYPASAGAADGLVPETYYLKDFLSPFLQDLIPPDVNPGFETDAHRSLAPSDAGPFPLVLFSHGAASYRLQSTFLTTHLASWGFVVVSPDYFERGLQSLLGVPPAPPHTDDKIVQLTLDAVGVANASGGPLEGIVDTSRLFPIGHSAGGSTSTRLAYKRTDVESWIAMASGYRPTAQIRPPSLADPTRSVAWIGGQLDGVADPASLHDAFEWTAGPRKLVMIPGAGHNNAFSDICEIGREFGGVVGIARAIGLPVPDSVLQLGQDGCVPPAVASEEVWPVTRHFVTAELRFRAGLDAEPVGLGTQVAAAFGSQAPTYAHDP